MQSKLAQIKIRFKIVPQTLDFSSIRRSAHNRFETPS